MTGREIDPVPGSGQRMSIRASWIENGGSRLLEATGRLDGVMRAGREHFFVLDGGKVLLACSRTICLATEDADLQVSRPELGGDDE